MIASLEPQATLEQLQPHEAVDFQRADGFATVLMTQPGALGFDQSSDVRKAVLDYQFQSNEFRDSGILDTDPTEATVGLGEELALLTPDGIEPATTLEFFKQRGVNLTEEQEVDVLLNAEYNNYPSETFSDRYTQTNIINSVIKDFALRALSDGEINQEFIDGVETKSKAKINELENFLKEKNEDPQTVAQAIETARNMLSKTTAYYQKHDILDTQPKEPSIPAKIGKLCGIAIQKVSETTSKVAEKGKSVVEKFVPRRNTIRRVGSLAIVTTVLSGAAIVGSVLGEMSIDSDDDKTEESVDLDEQFVSAINTTKIDSGSIQLPIETAVVGALSTKPEASEVEESIETTEEINQVVVDATKDATPQSEQPPLTPEEQAIIDQKQKSLLEMVDDGEYSLEGLAGNEVGSLSLPGTCLDDVEIFVTNAVDPVNNPAVLDGLDWSKLNMDPTLPYVEVSNYEAARERLNPLYRARLDPTPQEACVIEGESEYAERWIVPTKGSAEARAIASHPSELTPTATLHPYSSLPGRSGVTLIEAHRTTESAPFLNNDALMPGQTAEFTNGNTTYSYDFVEFRRVDPNISINEIKALYDSEDDVLILSTCDDGSAIRLLTILKRTA